ncbi:MAG: hypothetical protein CL930_03490 [Deltaproteobacteria bacterium]|nr:hypothetical protein [Deltaproteobacteria bacterium]
MEQVEGFVVLLDISGYTRFVRSHNLRHIPVLGTRFRVTSEAHAEEVVTDLLETLINATSDLLRPEKLEGDAVLFTAVPENPSDFAQQLVTKLQTIFAVFQDRIHQIAFCSTCLCDCCSQMTQLKVKAIVHHGPFLIKKVAGFREIAGQEIIRAHRLLKNTIDSDQYLLLTDSVNTLAKASSIIPIESHQEEDPDLGSTTVWVHYPELDEIEEKAPTESYLKRYSKMHEFFDQERDRDALIPAAK